MSHCVAAVGRVAQKGHNVAPPVLELAIAIDQGLVPIAGDLHHHSVYIGCQEFGIEADGGFAEPRCQHHVRPALAHARLATWRNYLALGGGPARVGQPLQAGVFEVMFLHYLSQFRCPPGQYAAEWLTELAAVGREPGDGPVVQVGRIPVSGSLSRVWLLL